MKTTITTHNARAAHTTNALAPMARAEGSVVGPSNAPASAPKRSARVYEGFLEMPVLVVLVVMWVGGAALLGSCALALYMAGSLLVSGIAGAL
jgi:nucleoside phosphorylase